MEEKKNILTYSGLKKLEDELEDLKVNQRKMIAQKIKEAREQGDLSENAEYRINIGCRVQIKDMEYNDILDYSIVGSTEANSLEGKISNESPVGKALIGARIGDVVEVEAPSGSVKFEILAIERNI